METLLKKIYYSLDSPAAFTGVDQILRAVKKQHPSATKRDVQQFLESSEAYTLHKQVRKRFPTRKYISVSKDNNWFCDLADVSNLKQDNSNITFLLTIIDLFTRYAWVVPIRDKSAKSIVMAFEKVLKEGRKPFVLASDRGTEFKNSTFQNLLKKYKIKYYNCACPIKKCVIVERFIKTLRGRLSRYLTHTRQNKYIDVLPKIVAAYNNSYHRSIKTTPKSASDNPSLIQRELPKLRFSKAKYKIQDVVRLVRTKKHFEKEATATHTLELFKIKKVHNQIPVMYALVDWADEDILGKFYEQEVNIFSRVFNKKKKKK